MKISIKNIKKSKSYYDFTDERFFTANPVYSEESIFFWPCSAWSEEDDTKHRTKDGLSKREQMDNLRNKWTHLEIKNQPTTTPECKQRYKINKGLSSVFNLSEISGYYEDIPCKMEARLHRQPKQY